MEKAKHGILGCSASELAALNPDSMEAKIRSVGLFDGLRGLKESMLTTSLEY
jgi:hypothetical protein